MLLESIITISECKLNDSNQQTESTDICIWSNKFHKLPEKKPGTKFFLSKFAGIKHSSLLTKCKPSWLFA